LNDNLYAHRLNRARRALEGTAELIVEGVASQPGTVVSRADFSVAHDGRVAWRAGKAALAQITVLDRQGATVALSGPPALQSSLVIKR
jgi:hypothetical protein